MFTGSWWESQKERDYSQDLEVDGKNSTKLILKNRTACELNSPGSEEGTAASSREYGKEFSASTRYGKLTE